MPPPEALDLSSALSGETLLEAAAMVLGFIALLFVASLLLSGRRVTGPDADGNERVHKLDGLSLYLIVMIAACGAQASGVLRYRCCIPIFSPSSSWRTDSRSRSPAGSTCAGCESLMHRPHRGGISSTAWTPLRPGSGWI